MASINSRDVDIYDSLAKILNKNTQLPLGPKYSISTKSYIGVLGPILTFFDSTNGGSKTPLLIMVGVNPPPHREKIVNYPIFHMI